MRKILVRLRIWDGQGKRNGLTFELIFAALRNNTSLLDGVPEVIEVGADTRYVLTVPWRLSRNLIDTRYLSTLSDRYCSLNFLGISRGTSKRWKPTAHSLDATVAVKAATAMVKMVLAYMLWVWDLDLGAGA